MIHSMDFLPQKPSQLAAFSVSGMLIASRDFQCILEILHVRYKKVDLKNHTAVFFIINPIVSHSAGRKKLRRLVVDSVQEQRNVYGESL